MTKIDAKWVAGFEAIMPDGTILTPHETVVQVGADEARESDNWQPVKGTKATKTTEGDDA